jgi:ATP-dependent RNA circularization protein (DNA/RNA ligase family)
LADLKKIFTSETTLPNESKLGGFRRRFLKIGQSETRIACGGHVCQWIGTK